MLATRTWDHHASSPPRALLVHGITSSAETMWELGEGLAAAGWEATAVDLPGHGDSGPAGSYRFADVADTIAGEFGPGFDLLVGHSLGGAIGTVLLARHQGVAARAVLLDPALRVPPAAAARLAGQLVADKQQDRAAVRAAHPHWHPATVDSPACRHRRGRRRRRPGFRRPELAVGRLRRRPRGDGARPRARRHRRLGGRAGPGRRRCPPPTRTGRSRPSPTPRTRCTATTRRWCSDGYSLRPSVRGTGLAFEEPRAVRRFQRRGDDVVDPAGRVTAAQGGEQRVDGGGRSLGVDLDPAVGQVLGVPGETEFECARARPPAEPHTLHVTRHQRSRPDPVDHDLHRRRAATAARPARVELTA